VQFQREIAAPESLSYCLCRKFERAPGGGRIANRSYCVRRAGIDDFAGAKA
jgi:hypothetical protein